jgi:tetratricopeptide (TPR) repeat protein
MKDPHVRREHALIEAEELFSKAEGLIAERKIDEALPLLKKTITLNRHFSFAYITLSKILFKLNRAEDAIKTLETCAASDRSYAYPHYLIAKYLYAMGKTDEAEKTLESARTIDKKCRLYERALIALKQKKS